MAHVKPLTQADLPQFKDRFEHYEKTRGFLPNSILTMARRPHIAEAFMQMNKVILYEGSVSEELKMLVSLISSQTSGCRYCQAHMSNLSGIYGSSAEKIENLWSFHESELFRDAERAALNLAHKASLVPNEAAAEDFDWLKQHFSEDEIVEIVATISLFGYLNRWNDTMATELEGLPAQRADEYLGRWGWQRGKHQ